MYKITIGIAFALLSFGNTAMAACTFPYTLTNGTTANATEVMANFNAVPSCITGVAPTTNPVFTGAVGVGTPSTATAIVEMYSSQPRPVITSTYTTTTTNDWYSMLRFRSPFGVGNGTISNDDAQIRIVRGNHSYPGDAFTHDADMTFWVNNSNRDNGPTEMMRLTSAGYLGIQTAAPSYPLHVNGTAYATGAAGALSDRRHKTEIVTLANGAADLVMRLRPVSFGWKEAKDSGMHGRQMGFIAQEVEEVLPSVILTEQNSEKTKGLKYNELIAVLTKALQEQQAEIRSLKAANDNQLQAVADLSAKLDALERRVRTQTAQR